VLRPCKSLLKFMILSGLTSGIRLLTTTEISRQFLVYPAIILIEPTMVTRELFNAHLEDRMASMDFAVAATATRRDTWTSKEHAFNYFSKRIPWGMWDSRIVRLYTVSIVKSSTLTLGPRASTGRRIREVTIRLSNLEVRQKTGSSFFPRRRAAFRGCCSAEPHLSRCSNPYHLGNSE